MKYLLLIFILIFNDSAYSENSIVTANYSYLQSSDQMFMHTSSLLFRSHRRDLSYPYENEDTTGWDFGSSVLTTQGFNANNNYNGQRGYLLLGRKFNSNFLIDFYSGGHRAFDTGNNNDKTIFIAELKALFHIDELLDISLAANRDYAYIYTIQPGGSNNRLTTNSFNFALNYNIFSDIVTRINENYFYISDQNTKSVTNIALLYGIATEEPWIWVGLGYENTSYKYVTTDYWSPSAFMAFGFRSEANLPIYLIDNIFINLELNYNRIWDKDTCTRGNGVAIASKLQFGRRENHNFSVFYNRLSSIQDGNLWYSNEAGVALNLMF